LQKVIIFPYSFSLLPHKMMDAYAQRRGIALESLRFTLDGTRVSPDDTPKMVSFAFSSLIIFLISFVVFSVVGT
jgi:hypothetical protein